MSEKQTSIAAGPAQIDPASNDESAAIMPAPQLFATRHVPDDKQGEFQGVLAFVVSLASIVAPLSFSSIYFLTATHWPGAIGLGVIVIQLFGAALVLTLQFSAASSG